jgi:phosphoglycolate phosphatase-like HAD superfamily hydrolase
MHAVIFDIDGTLLESVTIDHELYQQAVHHLLPDAHIRPAIAHYDYVSDSGILSQIFADNGVSPDQELAAAVQSRFVELLDRHITRSGAFPEIPGALEYLQHHIESSDHAVAYATGGWRASARLKLKAAGFGGLDVPLATADDALDRKDIMLTALSHLGESFSSITYYGDGPWDRDSSQQLGWNFVPVGSRLGGLESYQDLIR